MIEKYGFVYIWYDKKHKRFYIGCHWGTENDGYICSSPWMKQGYKHRPSDFKRKILKRIYSTRKNLLEEEYKWLCLIKKDELGKKYYNMHNRHFNHWSANEERREEVIEKSKQKNIGRKMSEETKIKISISNKGKKKPPFTQEHRTNISKASKGKIVSEETRKKRGEALRGEKNGNFGRSFSEEHRMKLSIARRKRIVSEETKKKISESLKNNRIYKKGYKLSDEHKQKISEALKTKPKPPISEEHKLKISKTLKGNNKKKDFINVNG